MSVILLMLCVLTISGQNIFKKQYNSKVSQGAFCFNAISGVFALLFFAIPAFVQGFDFDAGLIGYAFGYALAYVMACVGIYLAIMWGEFGITSLIYSYSTVIPTLYALLFLGEKMNVLIAIGLAALVLSLYLTNTDCSAKEKVSVKWVLAVIAAFVGNGMCSVIQNVQQLRFEGRYKNEYMTLALAMAGILFWGLTIWKDRSFIKENIQKGWMPAMACGICNGATNLLVMVLLGMMAASVLFPALSAGGIILSFIFSVFVYKEAFGLRQGIGVAFGIVAVVLLNL
ncbi:MAG: hypothetical protein UHS49_05020 [Faecalimonas sp.]|nr:hypothetical protein [Faecalimonas sp.]